MAYYGFSFFDRSRKTSYGFGGPIRTSSYSLRPDFSIGCKKPRTVLDVQSQSVLMLAMISLRVSFSIDRKNPPTILEIQKPSYGFHEVFYVDR